VTRNFGKEITKFRPTIVKHIYPGYSFSKKYWIIDQKLRYFGAFLVHFCEKLNKRRNIAQSGQTAHASLP
jgi:hypothetical protein